ncbi:MAG TPA: hypothetical protein VMV94_07455 [Phycisphaerae bacterium]|nr:hypothetical protein [Phycisphaerae bacterium]
MLSFARFIGYSILGARCVFNVRRLALVCTVIRYNIQYNTHYNIFLAVSAVRLCFLCLDFGGCGRQVGQDRQRSSLRRRQGVPALVGVRQAMDLGR